MGSDKIEDITHNNAIQRESEDDSSDDAIIGQTKKLPKNKNKQPSPITVQPKEIISKPTTNSNTILQPSIIEHKKQFNPPRITESNTNSQKSLPMSQNEQSNQSLSIESDVMKSESVENNINLSNVSNNHNYNNCNNYHSSQNNQNIKNNTKAKGFVSPIVSTMPQRNNNSNGSKVNNVRMSEMNKNICKYKKYNKPPTLTFYEPWIALDDPLFLKIKDPVTLKNEYSNWNEYQHTLAHVKICFFFPFFV